MSASGSCKGRQRTTTCLTRKKHSISIQTAWLYVWPLSLLESLGCSPPVAASAGDPNNPNPSNRERQDSGAPSFALPQTAPGQHLLRYSAKGGRARQPLLPQELGQSFTGLLKWPSLFSLTHKKPRFNLAVVLSITIAVYQHSRNSTLHTSHHGC